MAEVRQTDNPNDGTVDVSMLAPEDRRLVRHFVAWVRSINPKDKPHARWEAVAGEGRVKVYHSQISVGRERF